MRWMRRSFRVADGFVIDLDKSSLLEKEKRMTLFAAVPFRWLGWDLSPLVYLRWKGNQAVW